MSWAGFGHKDWGDEQVETWERVNHVAIEMSNREFGARGVVGGTGQYTGRGIRNSLIGKAVVALNGMFGYIRVSSQRRECKHVVCLCLCKSSNTARDHM